VIQQWFGGGQLDLTPALVKKMHSLHQNGKTSLRQTQSRFYPKYKSNDAYFWNAHRQ
jgi:coproporphyrinogen III oxidase